MRKLAGALLILTGVTLLALAIHDSDQTRAEITRILDNVPNHKTFWLVAGGTLAGVLGLGLLSTGRAHH